MNSSMDIETLRHDVLRFRRAIGACHLSLDAIIFGSFPRGCCGVVSELLSVFLQARGHGAFTYVCGQRFDGDIGFSSHAWLEQGKYIVDITQEQFDGRSEQPLVTVDRNWHDRRFPEQEKQRPFDRLSPALCIAYAHIQEELESSKGVS